jgi:ribosome-binding protein aMBF1 (putative translation factor)
MADSMYRRLVQMAIEVLGSQQDVAQFLGTTVDVVESWAAGTAEPAFDSVVRLVELIEQKKVSAARTATAGRSRRDEES